MTRVLKILTLNPAASLQDQGRPGLLGQGISAGGATDRMALAEGAALLGQSADLAALEMPGAGGTFQVSQPTCIALTGAPMRTTIDGIPLRWNASHLFQPGQNLVIGPALSGSCGYLHVGGGFDVVPVLGSRARHHTAGIGPQVKAGDSLPIGPSRTQQANSHLPINDRFSGGHVRIVPGIQTELFDAAEKERFTQTTFRRDVRSNRMAARLGFDGDGFTVAGSLNILSEIIVPGDIQITGDGTPFVLLPECQTTGGYPRIGTVIPPDLAIVAQATPKDSLTFTFVAPEDAEQATTAWFKEMEALPRKVRPLVRDPHDIADLLSYQLISGTVSAQEDPE